MKSQRIIAVHLLNDFSGSPFVLSQALDALQEKKYEIHLFTATPTGKGFLNDLPGVMYHPLFYRWSPNKIVTLFLFCLSQCSVFFRLLLFIKRGDSVYINSLLPFGAAMAGSFRRCHVIYHIHEVSIQPKLLKKFLLFIVERTACQCLFVSHYLEQITPLKLPGTVVYNSLPVNFIQRAKLHTRKNTPSFIVLMLCSLKSYKGIFQLIACAHTLVDIRFELVLNASLHDINQFFIRTDLPVNLQIFPTQVDVHPFYERASVVVNLSLPNRWIETFGMTILEAMYYKLPVIVPPVGGVAELVEDGVNGFCLDSRKKFLLIDTLKQLHTQPELYNSMSEAAYRKANFFTPHIFRQSITDQFEGIMKPDLLHKK